MTIVMSYRVNLASLKERSVAAVRALMEVLIVKALAAHSDLVGLEHEPSAPMGMFNINAAAHKAYDLLTSSLVLSQRALNSLGLHITDNERLLHVNRLRNGNIFHII